LSTVVAGNVGHMSQPEGVTRLTPLIADAVSVADEGDLGKVLRSLALEAKRATGARYVALGIIGRHGVLSEFIYEGISPEVAADIGHPPTGRGVLGTVIRDNESLLVDEISQHQDSVGFPPHHPPMSAFLGVPVAVAGEAFGNLYLTEKDGGFSREDMAIVEALSRIAGAAVQTARLQSRLRRVAVVEDRQRIARDLHDSVIQDLFAVGLGLQGLGARIEEADTAALLDDAIDTLDESVNKLRRYVFELRDSTLPAVGLDERLKLVVARMGSAYPVNVRLTLDYAQSGEWDNDIVLLTTEALSNALRHSRAENVEVSLSREGNDIVLRVSDDGTGFDPGADRIGMGLVNMSARAKMLHGSIRVHSELGHGATVEARLPMTQPAS